MELTKSEILKLGQLIMFLVAFALLEDPLVEIVTEHVPGSPLIIGFIFLVIAALFFKIEV